MNILLNLKINQRDCLQFITDIEDNDFINLNNTFISVWLKQSKKKLGEKQDHFVMGNSNYLRNLSIICKKKSDFGSGRIAKYYQDVRDL